MSMDEIHSFSRAYESQKFEIEEHHELVLDHDHYNQEDNRPCFIRWKSGKRVDPRLLTLLESFREVYEKRREFFKRIFPGLYNEFVEVFKKLSATMLKDEEIRSRSMARSLSFGTMRSVGRTEEGSELVLEKFKVRAPTVAVAGGSGGQGGQTGKGDTDPSNSN